MRLAVGRRVGFSFVFSRLWGRGLEDLANSDEPSLTAGCFGETVNASMRPATRL